MVVETYVGSRLPTGDRTGEAVPLLRRVRSDALPEEIDYRDDGCDIHPRCLTCPLPRCRYDEPGGLRAMLNTYRDEQVVALRRDGARIDQIAERYNLSRRTVFRILSTQGNGQTPESRRVALAARDRPSGSEDPDLHPRLRRRRREGSYA
jgi:hypothetical protein